MNKSVALVCIHCGTERIVGSSEEETIDMPGGGTTTIKRAKMICPDPECQKRVEKELLKLQEKRDVLSQAKEQRASDRRAALLHPKPVTDDE